MPARNGSFPFASSCASRCEHVDSISGSICSRAPAVLFDGSERCGQRHRVAARHRTTAQGIRYVSRCVYDIAATIFVHNGTQLSFGGGVFLRKVRAGPRPFAHGFLNQGAITREYDEQITSDGLSLLVNGVDAAEEDLLIPGLRGQLALFYVRNARVTKFRCLDLGAWQFEIHVCTFDRLAIRDVVVHGRKDGIHLGRGRAFEIRDYEAKTMPSH
eukprot:1280955-Prymnesium_polylepis.1